MSDSGANWGYFTPIVELWDPTYNWVSGAHLVGMYFICIPEKESHSILHDFTNLLLLEGLQIFYY